MNIKSNKTIKVGVIGVGAMGRHHARIYSQLPGVVLVGVADPNPETLEAVARQHGTTPYADYRKLLDMDLDAVSIAVPTSAHKDIALEAIARGQHVLVEKPVSNNCASAEQMIAQAREKRVKLMVGHVERFNPVIKAIKSALTGEDVISIDITRVGPFPPRITDVGIIVDLAIHDIDLIRHISGSEAANVSSVCSNVLGKHEDTAMLLFKMTNGVMAHITTNWLTPFKARTIQIATKSKFIRGDLITQKAQEYSQFSFKDSSFLVKDLAVPFAEPLKTELETFIQCIREDLPVSVNGEDGLAALKIAEKCLMEG